MTEQTPPIQEKKQVWPLKPGLGAILLIVILVITGAVLLGRNLLVHKVNPEEIQQQTIGIMDMADNNLYHYLRYVELFGNHFVMLRHNPTSQRIIVLMVKPDQQDVCREFFDKSLSPIHFSLLIQVFKYNSKFENRDIKVSSVAMEREGELEGNGYNLPYKYYRISTTVDGKPEAFEAYIGKITENNRERGLIFTFNSRNHASLVPFSDILKVVKPYQPEKKLSVFAL
jgi:hypothetical protein